MENDNVIERTNAIIVLNYNDAVTTIEFIKSAKRLACLDHIIVVDNCSTDNSYSLLKPFEDERIDVIQTRYNGGYAKGNNIGAFHAIEKYHPDVLIISNPDVSFTEEAVCKMEQALFELEDVGAVCCKMICTSDSNNPIAWKLPGYSDYVKENLIVIKKLLGTGTYYSEDYLSRGPYVKVDVVPGSMFAIKSDTFREVQGFDERTFLYVEEDFLAHKIKERGLQSYLLPDVEYTHAHSVSINKTFKSLYSKLKLVFESRLKYCECVLHIGILKKMLFYITFYIGSFSYLLLKHSQMLFKRNG